MGWDVHKVPRSWGKRPCGDLIQGGVSDASKWQDNGRLGTEIAEVDPVVGEVVLPVKSANAVLLS